MPDTRTSSLPDDSTVETVGSNTSLLSRRSGEESVRRVAQSVINRSPEGGDNKVRRRSRRARHTPILAGSGLQFHYGVGILLFFALIFVIFRDKISKNLWAVMHPPHPVAPVGSVQGVAVPVGPAPWWFHVEIPALLIGLAIWLYLTPGIWDSIKVAIGLRKDKERRARRRHS